ncbi:MAG: hypothetical protein QNJ70_24385 [Xenococcaceae cyanobacterium MO_207.B15]|nr:hypothetical protein [Xenococcaceae cyanobacterium MO_207.B15]
MESFNSPLNCTSSDLELETIKRFRSLSTFLPDQCRVFRELNGRFTVLCLDFTACPQELKTNKEQWLELARLLTHSSHELGLANSVVFKNGVRIVLIANMCSPGYSQCWIV